MIINFVEIILLFIIPVLLLYFKKINFKYRIHILSLIFIITTVIIVIEKWSLVDLGIRLDNIRESIPPYLFFTVISSLFLIIISKALKKYPEKNFYMKKHFIFGFIFVSVLQEFLFRGFLIPKLATIINPMFFIILVNAILFTFMHIIYFSKKSIMILLFISGIIFAYLHLNYPNFLLLSISHSILNYIAVMFGYFSEENN